MSFDDYELNDKLTLTFGLVVDGEGTFCEFVSWVVLAAYCRSLHFRATGVYLVYILIYLVRRLTRRGLTWLFVEAFESGWLTIGFRMLWLGFFRQGRISTNLVG